MIVIDIETLPLTARAGHRPTPEDLGWTEPARPTRRPPPKNYGADAAARHQEAEEHRIREEHASNVEASRAAIVEEWAEGSLDWRRARVGCVGLYDGTTPLVLDCERFGESETLTELARHIGAEVWSFGRFDARILRSRYLALGLPIPAALRVGAKPWDRRWHDLQELAAEVVAGGPREIRGVSVDALCSHLGIERQPSPVDGAGVLEAYLSGRWSEVVAHCRADVIDEWAILQRLRGAL